MKDRHYNNKLGVTLHKLLGKDGLDYNHYAMDVTKRFDRCEVNGKFLSDCQKMINTIYNYAIENPHLHEKCIKLNPLTIGGNPDSNIKGTELMKVKDALDELKRRVNIDSELKEMEEEFGTEIFVSEIKEILKPTGIELIDFLHDNKIDMQFDGDKLFANRAEVYDALNESTNIVREDAYGDNHYRCDNDRF